MDVTMGWLIDLVVVFVGVAHAIAAWLYFSREARAWMWPLAWLLATAACVTTAQSDPILGYGMLAALVAVWTVWWVSLRPSKTRNWVPENRHQSAASLHGDALTVHHVRNFEWTGKRAFVERWEDRKYDLAKLDAIDLFVCTWGDPRIAHTMVSFDFAGSPPLCFSIETRREVGEKWTATAGFMKSYELLMLAADERDIVKSRINLRGEDVRLYRVYSTPEMRRKIFNRYVAQLNRLSKQPRFYNTVFANCTIEIAMMVRAAGHAFPLDWRLLVSGYVAEFLYDLELLDLSRSFEELKAAADISAKSKAADAAPDYSRRIRVGLLDPQAAERARPAALIPTVAVPAT
jgi:Domain of unknown function (DUF4105)